MSCAESGVALDNITSTAGNAALVLLIIMMTSRSESALWNREYLVLTGISNGEAHRGIVATKQLGDYGVVVRHHRRREHVCAEHLARQEVVGSDSVWCRGVVTHVDDHRKSAVGCQINHRDESELTIR